MTTAFSGLRRQFETTMRHAAPREAVFPLLCPVRECDWIETWQCELIHAASGRADASCVFRADFPDEGPRLWVVSRYEPLAAIHFVVTGADIAQTYAIDLAASPGGCTSTWRQTYTGLTPAGNAAVAAMTEADWLGRKRILERMLNHYLATGALLSLAAAEAA